MSSQAPAPAATEHKPALLASIEPTPAAEVAASAPAAEATTDAAQAEVSVPAVAESASVDESKAAEATKPEEKKEKKPARKPFSELLNKILKPHPQEKLTPEKKSEAEGNTVAEEIAPEVALPASPATVPQPEALADASETHVASDSPAEAAAAEESAKDITTPRKERSKIFDKFTAFVMKPKSPKPKKLDAPKEDGDEAKAEPHAAETNADDVALTSPQLPVQEDVEVPAVEATATLETQEVKADKKEKSPKDLAKLARRFSGRLFGAEKKKESSKKPEPTEEEAELAAQPETLADSVAATDAAPQIPADATPQAPQPAADPSPVITAAA